MAGPSDVSGVQNAAPWSKRPPSPPYIYVPSYATAESNISLVPSFRGTNGHHFTENEIRIITQGTQTACDNTRDWQYESRRKAQRITDSLYLGPIGAARDHDFLKRAGITMILGCRDTIYKSSSASVEKAAQELGIEAKFVDVYDRKNRFIEAFKQVTEIINTHLLGFVGKQAASGVAHRNIAPGKVLVCCETGNDRSAATAAAYLMTIFKADHIRAMQFISLQRFCVTFDDDIKFILQTYEELLKSSEDVRQQQQQEQSAASGPAPMQRSKRRLDDTLDEDVAMSDGPFTDADGSNQRAFVPFMEGMGFSNSDSHA